MQNTTYKNRHAYEMEFKGKFVSATSANDFSEIKGKCIRVRECIDDYTDINKGIRFLADIENHGEVKVGLAKTMKIV